MVESPQNIRRDILITSLRRAQRQNKKFSMRSLAQKMQLSVGFLSKVMNGKSELPLKRIPDFCEYLKIDDLQKQALLKTYQPHGLVAINTQNPLPISSIKKYEELGDRSFSLLDEWYYLPLLDLTTCVGFQSNVEWISQKLKITPEQTQSALSVLQKTGLLTINEDGSLKKTSMHLRFPTTTSSSQIRKFHQTMMKKSCDIMNKQTTHQDFNKRLISGISIAADSKKIEAAKIKLNQFLYDLTEELSDGDSDQVYHLAVQFFPITD